MLTIQQASIDALAELGILTSCLMMMTLMQCIKSARWPDDGPLSIMPGVDLSSEKRRQKSPNPIPQTLMEVPSLALQELNNVMRALNVPLSDQHQFRRVAASIPSLDIHLSSEITGTTITVSIARKNAALNNDYRMYAPEFPKPQTEGYFVVLGNEETDEV